MRGDLEAERDDPLLELDFPRWLSSSLFSLSELEVDELHVELLSSSELDDEDELVELLLSLSEPDDDVDCRSNLSWFFAGDGVDNDLIFDESLSFSRLGCKIKCDTSISCECEMLLSASAELNGSLSGDETC